MHFVQLQEHHINQLKYSETKGQFKICQIKLIPVVA
jgi:hypothetical protein